MRFSLGWLFLLVFSSCASHSYLNAPGHGAFQQGNYEMAGDLFAKDETGTNNNKLLFQLDSGTSYFNAGDFDKAIPQYLQAVKFWESKDYTSISESIGKYAISENVKTYVGEDYERILIHAFLALSYAGEEKIEDAQVEARRINELLIQMRDQEKKNYTESAFARVLSAIMWEATGEWDSARIDYEAAYQIEPNFPGLKEDLLRSCVASGYTEKVSYWHKRFPEIKIPNVDKKLAEVVAFVTYGQGPIKIPNGSAVASLPVLRPRPWTFLPIELEVGTKKYTESQIALDIEDLTRKFFDEKMKWLAARKVITLGVKAGAAYAVSRATKNSDLGALTFLALAAMDTADVRGWNTLPAGVRIMRIPVEAGNHDINFRVMSKNGTLIKDLKLGQRKLLPGGKLFLVLHEG